MAQVGGGVFLISDSLKTIMPPLSEKAKGKQRAESLDVTSNPPPVPARRELAIRFTEGVVDLMVTVGETDTVRNVKNKVCAFIINAIYWINNILR
jgi:hypothetical protein